jgi:hypothetical protein
MRRSFILVSSLLAISIAGCSKAPNGVYGEMQELNAYDVPSASPVAADAEASTKGAVADPATPAIPQAEPQIAYS